MRWCAFPSVSSHSLLKIPKDRLFQPHSGPWSSQNAVLAVSCPIVFMVLQTSLLLFSNKIQASVQCNVLTSASGPQRHHVLAEVSQWQVKAHKMHDLKPFYGSCSRTDCQWCEHQHFLFVHNHGFCFLQVRCPTVFASSGHCGLLKFGLQDTSPYKVIRKCAAPIASN